MPDTLRLFDVGSNLNKDELAQVDDVFTYMQKYKIVFQFPLNKAQITDINKKVFLNFFLVFPQDNSSDRWLGNIYKIEVYKI